jgi:hypothetical protein
MAHARIIEKLRAFTTQVRTDLGTIRVTYKKKVATYQMRFAL